MSKPATTSAQAWSPDADHFKQWMRDNVPPPTLDHAGVQTMRFSYDAMAPRPLRPYTVRGAFIDDLAVEWVMAEGARSDHRILNPHGGAFVSGSKQSHRGMAFLLSEVTGAAVLLFEHRLAPEHQAPAALDDTMQAYRWMLENGPDGPEPVRNFALIGDSAGGNLTCAGMMRARDEGLRLPACAVGMSCWNDMAGKSPSRQTRIDLDPFLNPPLMQFCASQYVGDGDPTDPSVSPVYGDYRDLPPILFQVGDHEILLDDTVRSHERALETGCRSTLEVWPGMFHTWQFWADVVPEGRQAVDRLGAFVRKHWG